MILQVCATQPQENYSHHTPTDGDPRSDFSPNGSKATFFPQKPVIATTS